MKAEPPRFSFSTELWLPRQPSEVFPFFADAFNLAQITPPWLGFHVITPGPIDMHEGTLIDYKLRLRGLPLRWRTEITAWEPPHRFVDRQIKGPYRTWIHEHRFEAQDGGTLCTDHVQYDMMLGRCMDRLLIRRDVERIFAYRQDRLRTLFSEDGHAAPD